MYDTPPTVPGPIPGPEPSWPKPVGILAIVFGSYGILEHVCGAASPLFMGLMTQAATQALPAGEADAMRAQADAMAPYLLPLLLGNMLLLGSAVLLLVAGIRCVSRHPACRQLMLIYAAAELVLTMLYLGLSWVMNNAVMAAVAQSPSTAGAPPGMMSMIGTLSGVAGFVLGLLFLAPWPIFLLIWFNRRTVKDQVLLWRAERLASLPTM